MSKKRAFTLVELLAVIAIIALLMAILMPALARAKKQAMSVACQARLHQWGVIVSAYANNNDGYIYTRRIGDAWGWHRIWYYVYKPYYKDKMMRYCPAATNDNRVGGAFGVWYWGYGDYIGGDTSYIVEGESEFPQGSYGENRYVINIGGLGFENSSAFWRRIDVKGAEQAPNLSDCQYVNNMAGPDNPPPEFNGDWSGGDSIQSCCIDRHLGGINVLFLDSSARKVGLKELWTLKWARDFDTCGKWTMCYNEGQPLDDWPDWMKDYKDY